MNSILYIRKEIDNALKKGDRIRKGESFFLPPSNVESPNKQVWQETQQLEL